MSTVVSELLNSRDFGTDGGFKATRRFLVYDDAGGQISAEDVLDNADMPTAGNSHPDFDILLAQTYSVVPSSDAAGVWEVVWNYSPQSAFGDINETGEEILPLSVTAGVTAVDIYKSDPTLPADPSNPGASTDIGGTLVSEGGQPISYWLPNSQISVTETISGSSFNAYGLLSSTGKRNQNSFLGLPPGSVVFKGVNISRQTANTYTVVYEFGWDAWFHLRQVCQKDSNGRPVVNTDAVEMEVYWRQPFEETIGFGFISSL